MGQVGQKQNDEVRREMLAAIREQLAASVPFDAVRGEHHAAHESEAHPAIVARSPFAEPLERFKKSLEAVGGHCIPVKDEGEAGEELRKIISQHKAQSVALSDSPLVGRVAQSADAGAELLKSVGQSELFACDMGVTGAQWAIAETGTLCLESDKERHRLTSLVPPVHVAIIEADCIRQTLGEVLQAISDEGRENLSRTITFITGPSRTSDIELTLAIGVHGPAELHVIVIKMSAPSAVADGFDD